ncbi:hypothetical protein HMPREF3208_00533 [Gardnerella vaginalis]|uniref:Uncharacterized protein n=1 Tax=Gardnerella vaginalis TaxID=2702 RepID=A0A133NZ91_GARVA|nr:hypothetical protein [Gardnerella vaginalis]KXA21611.1 hypothetical protein HMPREF3208_00533 [Gardnerella vaginalis]
MKHTTTLMDNTIPVFLTLDVQERILRIVEKVDITATCARWLKATGESLDTLQMIALRRIMIAWKSEYLKVKNDDELAQMAAGWMHVTAFNALSEYARELTDGARVIQMPETDTAQRMYGIDEQHYDLEELNRIIISELDLPLTANAIEDTLSILTRIGKRYRSKYSAHEWGILVRKVTSYHPDMALIRALKKVCVTAFQSRRIPSTSLEVLHNIVVQPVRHSSAVKKRSA